MKLYVFFFIVFFILTSCKSIKNALDLASFPENISVKNITDTALQNAFLSIDNALINDYLIESKDSNNYTFLHLSFLNDSVNAIEFVQKKNGQMPFVSQVNFKPNINSFILTDSFSLSLKFIDNLNLNVTDLPIVNHKKGHKYDDIINLYHSTLNTYFDENYTLLLKDTLYSWNEFYYSKTFDKKYYELQNFLEHSIAYYRAFPEKMAFWPDYIRNNMIFLGKNLGKTYEELFNIREDAIQKNEIEKSKIINVLMYLSSDNSEEYRMAQIYFSSDLSLRWYHFTQQTE